MIKANGITLQRGTKVLLEDASFVVNPGERLGIVGRNGSGKTTLFALLQGQIDADAGDLHIPVAWQIASVKQVIDDQDKRATEFVIDGDQHLRELQRRRQETPDSDGHRIAELELALEEAGVWTAQSRAEQLLAGLGFQPELWQQSVRYFSGGWQMRLALARALMKPSDLLLLDEPTNHLDLDAMLWLEKWLSAYKGTVLLISHDTEFLNNVAQHILNFDHQKLIRYKGNYDAFIEQKAEHTRQTQLAHEKQQREIAHMQSFIDRFKAKATKAKQAQSRVKALARMQQLAPLQTERQIYIQLPQPQAMPDPLITAEHLQTGYAGADQPKVILTDVNFMVRGGARIGILGVNGAGKSTLVKTLAGELPALAGQLHFSKGVKIAYFAQQQLDMLDLDASPLLHLQRLAPESREQELRNYLGSFGFQGDKATDAVRPFSGGEKARLALALLVWQKPNLLLLDEPSNHLDVETREALAEALAVFEGSLLLVSHDRHLLKTTVDNFWIVADGKLQDFDGDLDDYKQWLFNYKQQTSGQVQTDSDDAQASSVDRKTQKRLEAEERQRLSQLRKPLQTKLDKIEQQLQRLNQELQNMDALIADPVFYQDDNKEQTVEVLSQHGQLSARKNALEEEWLVLSEELENLR
ncbi:ribosomal protection-like ABC-F family protein [Brackiella oedipodis]|uniref:ribosomal protection-like ABC-F family protein n=1 Tax=Brackiella oedipodis TaxID=124225 RepID=UPI00048D5F71|nr:ATP-binding cassette domain-containing protein [Brackiella oedipodis]